MVPVSILYLFCVFMCQTSPVRLDGILNIPPTYNSAATDPRTLPTLLSNACPEVPPCIPHGTRLIESIKTPIASQETCTIQEISIGLSSAPEPFKTVSISGPLVDLQTDPNSPIQPLGLNIAIAPHITSVSPINLHKMESCDVIKSNVLLNDCSQTAPPTIQKVPAYFVTCKDDCLRNSNVPITTLKVDDLPSNICKIKVGDSKPIFIDCSKQTNIYKSPIALTPVNTIGIQNLCNPDPNLQVIPKLGVSNQPNLLNEFISQTMPVKMLQDNPIVPMRLNDVAINEPCMNIFPSIEQINTETQASTDKVLYPINNVKFNFGPNVFTPIQSGCPEKPQPVTPPKLVPIDNNMGVFASPVVNIVPNVPTLTQCDVILPENGYCNCNQVNSLPKLEPIQSFPPCMFNPASIFSKEELPIPISQLPNVNTISTIPMQSVLSSPVTKSIYETSQDTFTSGLSYSLNNIVSLLTTGLLSKLFGMSAEKPLTDIVPIECDAFKEPILDVIPSINIEMPLAANIPLVTCPPLVESPPMSLNPLISIELKESESRNDAKITPALCTKDSLKRKPYIASITINVTPNTDSSNDIIIIV